MGKAAPTVRMPWGKLPPCSFGILGPEQNGTETEQTRISASRALQNNPRKCELGGQRMAVGLKGFSPRRRPESRAPSPGRSNTNGRAVQQQAFGFHSTVRPGWAIILVIVFEIKICRVFVRAYGGTVCHQARRLGGTDRRRQFHGGGRSQNRRPGIWTMSSGMRRKGWSPRWEISW
jgi:hypothetical protein